MIWDCCIFFNEIDLLVLRLKELWDVVDRFVVIEATTTFQGKPKPLNGLAAWERLAPFASKLRMWTVQLPEKGTAKQLEDIQRDAVTQATVDAAPEDLIMLSDSDEIPHPESIPAADCLAAPNKPVVFEQLFSFYFLNTVRSGKWQGTAAQHKGDMPPHAAALRSQTRPGTKIAFTILRNAGWHFSFLGGAAGVVAKIKAYAHLEKNTPAFTDMKLVQARIKALKDPFDRAGCDVTQVVVDEEFPKEVQLNMDQYTHLLLPEIVRCAACGHIKEE